MTLNPWLPEAAVKKPEGHGKLVAGVGLGDKVTHVTLNGQPVADAFEASEQDGYVKFFDIAAFGAIPKAERPDRLPELIRYGDVVVHFG